MSPSALQNPARGSDVRSVCAVGNQQLLLWSKPRGWVFGVGWNAVGLTLSVFLAGTLSPQLQLEKTNRSWNHLSGTLS